MLQSDTLRDALTSSFSLREDEEQLDLLLTHLHSLHPSLSSAYNESLATLEREAEILCGLEGLLAEEEEWEREWLCAVEEVRVKSGFFSLSLSALEQRTSHAIKQKASELASVCANGPWNSSLLLALKILNFFFPHSYFDCYLYSFCFVGMFFCPFVWLLF
jgi:hypothetical protein